MMRRSGPSCGATVLDMSSEGHDTTEHPPCATLYMQVIPASPAGAQGPQCMAEHAVLFTKFKYFPKAV